MINYDEKLKKIKIFTLGNACVGKTCFILKFTENKYENSHIMTAGIDLKMKIIELSNKKRYNIFFYDTAGQEKFKSISANSIKSADGIILMYDITNQKSYDDISCWMNSIIEHKGKGFPMVLLGNKCDLENERIISTEEGYDLAQKYSLKFFETSNKLNTNINNAGLELINLIIDKNKEKFIYEENKNENENKNIELNKSNSKKKKHSCKC